MKIYKCDYDHCKETTKSVSEDWLTIGTENNNLCIENNLPEKKLISLDQYHDIHFCSKKCFISTFFKK